MIKIKVIFLIFIFSIILIFFSYRAWILAFESPLPITHRPVSIPVRRGIIFDQHAQPLAISRDTLSIGIRPTEIINPKSTAELLANSLGINRKKIFYKLTDQSTPFRYLARKINHELGENLKSLRIPGLIFRTEADRFYPNGRLASHVLGFVGVDNEGLAGIEYQFNQALSKATNDGFSGNNLYLTINALVQYKLERALRDVINSANADGGVGIIMEVDTGKIRAMASLPEYDPNYALKSPELARRNRAIAERYEPGSTFKIFTLATIFRETSIKDNQTFPCPGKFHYKGITIRDSKSLGNISLRDVIKQSCNAGIIYASWKIPIIRFYENLKAFGFGTSTGIELPGESVGHLPHPKKWDLYLKSSIPIGHGLSATPLQLLASATSLAGAGRRVKPVIIEKITNSKGEVLQTETHSTLPTRINHKIANRVRNYLTGVVSPGGTGASANLTDKGIDVCGKTGTSIKSGPKGYYKNRHQASFLGFFPCHEPELAILIWIDEPKGDQYLGGKLAAPVFRRVLLETIPNIHQGKKLKISKMKDQTINNKKYSKNIMPNLIGKSKKETLFILFSHFPGNHRFLGKGYVLKTFPPPGKLIEKPYSFQINLGTPP